MAAAREIIDLDEDRATPPTQVVTGPGAAMESESSDVGQAKRSHHLAWDIESQAYIHGVPLKYTTGIELNVLKNGSKALGTREGKGIFPGVQPSQEELDPKPDNNAAQGYIWVGMTPSDPTLAKHMAAVTAQKEADEANKKAASVAGKKGGRKGSKDTGVNGKIGDGKAGGVDGEAQGSAQAATATSARRGRRPTAGYCEHWPAIEQDPRAMRVVKLKTSKSLQFYKLTARDAGTNLCVKEMVQKEHVFFFSTFLGLDVHGKAARNKAVIDEIAKIASGSRSAGTLNSEQPKTTAPAAQAPGPQRAGKPSVKSSAPQNPFRSHVEKPNLPPIPGNGPARKENREPGKVVGNKPSGYQKAKAPQAPINGLSAKNTVVLSQQSGGNGAQSPLISQQPGVSATQSAPLVPPAALAQYGDEEHQLSQIGLITGRLDAPLAPVPLRPPATPIHSRILNDLNLSSGTGYSPDTSRFVPNFADTPCRRRQSGDHLNDVPSSATVTAGRTPHPTNTPNGQHAGTPGGQHMETYAAPAYTSGPNSRTLFTNDAHGQDATKYRMPAYRTEATGQTQPTDDGYRQCSPEYDMHPSVSEGTGQMQPTSNGSYGQCSLEYQVQPSMPEGTGLKQPTGNTYGQNAVAHPVSAYASGATDQMQSINNSYGQHSSEYPMEHSISEAAGHKQLTNGAYGQDATTRPMSAYSSGTTDHMQLVNNGYGQQTAGHQMQRSTSGAASYKQPANNAYGQDMMTYPVPACTPGATGDMQATSNTHGQEDMSGYQMPSPVTGDAGDVQPDSSPVNSAYEQNVLEFQVHPSLPAPDSIMRSSNGAYAQNGVHHGGLDTHQFPPSDVVPFTTLYPGGGLGDLDGMDLSGPDPDQHNAVLRSNNLHTPAGENVTGYPPSYEAAHKQFFRGPSHIETTLVAGGAVAGRGQPTPQPLPAHKPLPAQQLLGQQFQAQERPAQEPQQRLGRLWKETTAFNGNQRKNLGSQVAWPGVHKSTGKPQHLHDRAPLSIPPSKKLTALIYELETSGKIDILDQLVALTESITRNDAIINSGGWLGAHFKAPSGDLSFRTGAPVYEEFIRMFPDLVEDITEGEFNLMLQGMQEADAMVEYKHVRPFIYCFATELHKTLQKNPALLSHRNRNSKPLKDELKRIVLLVRGYAASLFPANYDQREEQDSDGEEDFKMTG
ncbi:hypothetical protein MAPG_01180 [Magnaporthiopsis poae ATCC 64411]|uniref:Uncharacterized protein n=1 Tax=Magnaporthiopsis poae (strain ATCC 64411 / 73-15) TaxID=644358 RepID=A0A0C4DN08_MAGP6|nr:hypothetical protein MAPG_01180 [Magnaporthiopsis poae ATCC 64411]